MKKLRNILGLAFIFMLIFNTSILAATTFKDVEGTLYEEAVTALKELGIMDGMQDGTFGIEKTITRAQAAKLLTFCMGLEDSVRAYEGKTEFKDVSEIHWASGYINIMASELGHLSGDEDGTFKPDENIIYSDLIAACVRCLGYGPVVEKEGVHATSYLLKAIELKLLDDMHNPKAGEEATKGNTAILLWNTLRTPMWKISGGTSSTTVTLLEAKFPDYKITEEDNSSENDSEEENDEEKKEVNLSTRKYTQPYTGQEQSFISNTVDIKVISSDVGVERGVYSAIVALRDKEKYIWSDGTTEDREIKWEIVKGTFVLGRKWVYEPSQKILKTYTGEEHEVFPFGFEADKMEIFGNKAVQAGKYEMEVALKDKENYLWNDRDANTKKTYTTVENRKIEWEIEKVTWDCEIMNKNQVDGKTQSLQYVITPNVTNGMVLVSYCKENSTEYITTFPNEAGTYQVKIELKNDQNLIDGIYKDTIVIIESLVEKENNTSVGSDSIIEGGLSDENIVANEKEEEKEEEREEEVPVIKTYTVKIKQTTGGKITTKNKTVEEGENQEFTINPKDGYRIKDVKVDGKSVGVVSVYVLENVKKVHTITAEFEKIPEEDNDKVEEALNPSVNQMNFDDVKETDWHYQAVNFVTNKGLFKGVSETRFGANVTMNRAMVVTVLHRLAGEESVNTEEEIKFSDVVTDSYYEKAVKWAVKNGIVNGTGEKQFSPNNPITREQLVIMLSRYAKWMKKDLKASVNLEAFDDSNQINDYAKEAFMWAIENKLISGRTETMLVPQDTASRVEVATVLMRFSEKIQ